MDYEYKCVGAPERPKRSRGAKTGSDRLAVAMEEIIHDEAVDGWEYMRTDLVPVIEKSSLLGRAQEVHRAVLVFRREIGARRGARASDQYRQPAPDHDDGYHVPEPQRRSRRTLRDVHDEQMETAEPAVEEPPRRRAVQAEDPLRLSADEVVDAFRGRRTDRSPPRGLG